jgi:ABC-type glycerol-3-phosphate transport system substrate-binding protein
MRHDRQRSVRFRKSRLVAVGAVAVLTLAACGSAGGTSKTPAGQSPTVTTAASGGGYNY